MWDIELALDECPLPSKLCRCLTPEVVSAIVLALCRASELKPITIRAVEPPPPADPPGMGAFTGGT